MGRAQRSHKNKRKTKTKEPKEKTKRKNKKKKQNKLNSRRTNAAKLFPDNLGRFRVRFGPNVSS